jgi:hypothetical protein
MSLGIYPVFRPKVRAAKFDSLGEGLARAFEALDRIADAHGATRLSAFADTREVPADFDGDPDELAERMGPWTEWFDASQGKAAFQALADILRKEATARQQLEHPESVVAELEELVRVLAIAEQKRAKFRLETS